MTIELKQDSEYVREDWWHWSLWVEAEDADLDEIESVEYTLHPTFRDPVRLNTDRDSKFRLSSSGWGVFTIYVKINKKNGEVIDMEHELELNYPDESGSASSRSFSYDSSGSVRARVATESDTSERDSLIDKKIDEVLRNPSYEWRTLSRIAIEAGLSEEEAANRLRANEAVRFSRNIKTGQTIVGLRERVGDTPSSSST